MGDCNIVGGESGGVELISRDLVSRSGLEIFDGKVERDDELSDEWIGLLEKDQKEERYELADY